MKMGIVTMATPSHLPHLKTLVGSIRRFHPDWPVYALIVTGDQRLFDLPRELGITPIYLEDLDFGREGWLNMAFYYSAYEFCCALRPFLHEYALNKTELDGWFYFDNDIFVYDNLSVIVDELREAAILLSPHLLNVTTDTQAPSCQYWKTVINLEKEELCRGAFNGGFLGLRRSEPAALFLAWWKSRLRFFCLQDYDYLFLDQLWLSLVPQYFENVKVSRHPGANVACWNLHERRLEKNQSGEIFVNENKLSFFHFSGLIETQLPRVVVYDFIQKLVPDNFNIAVDIAIDYKKMLITNGYGLVKQGNYEFASFTSGALIRLEMRRRYYEDVMAKKVSFTGSPFEKAHFFYKNELLLFLKTVVRRCLKFFYKKIKSCLPAE